MKIMSFLILSKIFTLEECGQDYSEELNATLYLQFDSVAVVRPCILKQSDCLEASEVR